MKLLQPGCYLALLVLVSSSNRVLAQEEGTEAPDPNEDEGTEAPDDPNALNDEIQEIVDNLGVDILDPVELAQLVDGFGSCTFCDSGDIIPDQQFAGSPCSEWEQFSVFSKAEECAVLRAAAVEMCGCQMESVSLTTATPTCNLCPDGSLDGVQMDKRLPTISQQLTCEDVSSIPAVEEDKTCEAVSGFGYICGCPGTTPQCNLCSDGSAPTRPDAILPKGSFPAESLETQELSMSKVGADDGGPIKFGVGDPTCASFAEELTMNTKSACPAEIQKVQQQTGLFAPAYCGCPNEEQPANIGCDACPPGYKIKNLAEVHSDAFSAPSLPTIHSCEEWVSEYAPFMAEEEKCAIAQSEIAPQCCEEAPAVEEDMAVPVSLQAASASRSGSLSFLTLFVSTAVTATLLR